MKTFKERAIELANDCKRVKGNNVYETLAKEFNIGKRTAGDRFKSLFGRSVRSFITDNITPSKELLTDCIIKADTYEEMYKLSGFNNIGGLGKLMHKYYGKSNFFKVKIGLESKIPCHKYSALREDNESILISQFLGDGYFERDSCVAIEHGHKQYEYLKFKVSLLNKAFPMTNGLGAIKKRTHSDGYISYRYRSGQVLGKQIFKITHRSLKDNVFKLTPLGVCLYFLDDGWLSTSVRYNTIELGFGSVNEDLRAYLISYFKTFGYNFSEGVNQIQLRSRKWIIRFLKDFIEPYIEIIPKCLHYKFNYKDIVG